MIPITFQIYLLIFLCQRQMDFGERVGYYKLNWVMTSISPAAPDVISFLEQINTCWHLIFRYWSGECFFSPLPVSKDTRKSLHTASRSNNIASFSSSKVVSIMLYSSHGDIDPFSIPCIMCIHFIDNVMEIAVDEAGVITRLDTLIRHMCTEG